MPLTTPKQTHHDEDILVAVEAGDTSLVAQNGKTEKATQELLQLGEVVQGEGECEKYIGDVQIDAQDLANKIGNIGPRSPEARELEKNLHGNIILRPDGRIDFPQMGIVGVARLSSKEKSNPEKGILQGDYEGQYNSKGVAGLTYLTGKKAMDEVEKQNLKLFSASEAEQKTKQFLEQFGATGKEQSRALQTLFGKEFSGYWHPFNKKRTTMGGSIAYLVLSEVNTDGNVSAVEWTADDATQCWNYQHTPQPFLAFEKVESLL